MHPAGDVPQMPHEWHPLHGCWHPAPHRAAAPSRGGTLKPLGAGTPARWSRAAQVGTSRLVQASGPFGSLLLSPGWTRRSGRISKFPPDSAVGGCCNAALCKGGYWPRAPIPLFQPPAVGAWPRPRAMGVHVPTGAGHGGGCTLPGGIAPLWASLSPGSWLGGNSPVLRTLGFLPCAAQELENPLVSVMASGWGLCPRLATGPD